MRYIKSSLLAFAIFSLSWSTLAKTDLKPIDENLLFKGVWSCFYETQENGVSVIINSEDNYVRNGYTSSYGSLVLKFEPDLLEIEYLIASTSKWEIKDRYLITVLTDIKITNISHPDLDKEFNLENLFPKNISDSAEIIELSDSRLTIKTESNGEVYSCNRKKK